MSQTPKDGDYFASQPAETYGNADPYATPVDPYATPVDPYATPVDPYAAPVDPYVSQTTSAYALPTDQGTSGTADVAKDEAANVKGAAVEQGQQVAGTAKNEALNVAGTAQAEVKNVAGTAQEEVKNVAGTAVAAGQQVVGTAKAEAENVVVEAGAQAKDIARQAVSELQTQASTQQQKVAGLVHSYAEELSSLASGKGSSGPITDLTQRASDKAREVGQWLEDREPGELVTELTSLARRRPGAFLLGSALLGVVVGRLTRNLAADAKDEAASQGYAAAPTYTGTAPTYTGTAPTYNPAPLATAQDGRYGDLASQDQVVGYDTPVRTVGQDIR